MEASPPIPAEVQAAADQLGVDVPTLLAGLNPQAAAPVAETPAAAETPAEPVVTAGPAETREQQLERQLAESQQEVQQVRRMAQVAEEGRVVGSAGGGVVTSSLQNIPGLGSVEPGIRYDYLNGNMTDQELIAKIGPLLAALLKKHEGGVI